MVGLDHTISRAPVVAAKDSEIPAARAALVLLLCGVVAGGCLCGGGSNGVLAGAGADARFVTERASIVVSRPGEIHRSSLDGSAPATLFAGSYSVLDVTLDYRTYLLSDSETNLLVGDAATGALRPVPALARRVTHAAFSPGGARIAAVRHADFSLPQATLTDDDTVFLIDAGTLAAEVVLPGTDHWPARVAWSADGSALWITMNHGKPPQWLTLADKKRQSGLASPPGPLLDDPRLTKPRCPQQLVADTMDTELRIIDTPSAAPRVLVRLEGRSRGFHDYLPDFDHFSMSPACKYVVFEHGSKVWIADASTGALGPLAPGSWLFFEKPAPP